MACCRAAAACEVVRVRPRRLAHAPPPELFILQAIQLCTMLFQTAAKTAG